MSIFAIADTHLSLSTNKSMEIFGSRWENYIEKLSYNWNSLVSEDDTVVIAGDISWGMNFNQSIEDFKFINSLKGNKILIKGNHDFWWDTMSKMKSWLAENNLDTIKILHNNAYAADGFIICGSRGWFVDETLAELSDDAKFNQKIMNREINRIVISICEAKKLKEKYTEYKIYAFIHYPPIYGDYICGEIIDLLSAENIEKCYYGHIHNAVPSKLTGTYRGIRFELIAADYIKFNPVKIY